MSNYWGVMPAAGSGKRFGGDIPKQYIRVAGDFVIEHSLRILLRNDKLDKVIVSLANGDDFWSQVHCGKDPRVIDCRGGESRALSVMAALEILGHKASTQDWVIVHDAVRPCLKDSELSGLIKTMERDSVGGLLIAPVNETIKRLRNQSRLPEVECTLDRECIVRALTPQMFRFGLLCEAIEAALSKGIETGDEAQAMELAGHRVRVVTGGGHNLKLTYAYELPLIESWLENGHDG